MATNFDRTAEDLGNIVGLEHVNVTVPDQQIATLFYIKGLGLTRDPYIMTELDNMWVNVGRSQFHLPTKSPQVLRGHAGLVLPDRAALLKRLAAVKERLAHTKFSYAEHEAYVEATCPWGNRIRCHAPDEQRFGRIQLGMPYVEFEVPPGTASGIANFYRQVLKTHATVEEDAQGRYARVMVGKNQHLHFRELDRAPAEYDGHHIQVYLADFSGPYKWLLERGLVSEESDQYQYRFLDIVDPATARPLFRIEHEVRSMTHPLYARPLVNRNPTQTNRNYAPGYDALIPGMEHAS
jgi:catechol 2,3-dioxygenase-like lactoylglutathione lyase family enzyme